jgi:hypothetical protein
LSSFVNCHPEEGFSPTKDLLLLAGADRLLRPNRRSFNSAEQSRRGSAQDGNFREINLAKGE